MSTMSKDLATDLSKFYERSLHDEFRTPEPGHLNQRTKLVHGTVYSEKLNSSTHFSFALQPKQENGKDAKKPVVVLTATKDNKSKSPFIIKNTETKKEVGRVMLQFKTMKYISYAVFRGDVQVASIVYHVPTIRNFLSLDPPRAAQVAIPDPIEKNPTWLADVCKESILNKGSLKAAADESPGLVLLQNAVPYKKPDGSLGLNFYGRGQQASCRNMQLIDTSETVVCQVAKWDTCVHNVDFASPFSSFLAFAFALAQLDL
ncbi:hypothetical protein FisN_3Hh074 [Fistulifera solaris]|jgi:hypothetical protein|uniref:Tubby C-terminal domain-containing protein n=1 Tax=Fistulifera solaris TaxID=1519565 RepID=A0A1Z5JNN0_FISSO|nr:hypothetical protein FisN_3Hh074 [Fistulifera solaris]|eukprot:GAX15604.1 hypothetical protein FisN_3Hh074 [Fistulifera solaris]